MKTLVAADFSQKLYINGKLMKDVDITLKGDEKGVDISSNIDGKSKKKYVSSSEIKHILGSPSSTESLEVRLGKLLSNKKKNKSRKQKKVQRKLKNRRKTRKNK